MSVNPFVAYLKRRLPLVESALGNAAAESALRAVRGCQPFHLPPESYEGWRDIEWVFDPRQML